MAQVSSPKPAAQYHEQPNRIISITEAKQIMVRYASPTGEEKMVLVLAFGETIYGKGANAVRMPGLWVLANDSQLSEQLRKVPLDQAKQLVALMEERGMLVGGKIASSGTPSVTLPDVSSIFEDESEEKPEEKKE